jgi:hypothetical protein
MEVFEEIDRAFRSAQSTLTRRSLRPAATADLASALKRIDGASQYFFFLFAAVKVEIVSGGGERAVTAEAVKGIGAAFLSGDDASYQAQQGYERRVAKAVDSRLKSSAHTARLRDLGGNTRERDREPRGRVGAGSGRDYGYEDRDRGERRIRYARERSEEDRRSERDRDQRGENRVNGRERRGRECGNCFGAHATRTCTGPRLCRNCHAAGHLAAACTQPVARR